MNAADRYINERYIDAFCRDTGMEREQAIAALRRALDLPTGDLQVCRAQVPRAHSPGAVLLVVALFGTAWTATAAVVGALICGWRP